MKSPPSIKVLVIDEDRGRAALLEQSLRDQGYEVLARLDNTDLLAERVEELHPDMIIIDLDSPSRDVLEDMALLNDRSPRPVVMFAEQGDSDTISKAIRSGVSAYVVDGLEFGRISSILDVAAARFREFQALRRELVEARSELADRKLIEKAKGLVMKRHKCPEDEAFKAMRRMAMDQQKPLADIARNIIAVMEII
ncbi:ANTAR domain-containing response regulator [Marinobacterium sedimentorum]|uniref:ANTAR domain-containing response regulator n=1 Tax=Marinobacterium sedimentorum TaxID=2927804 RepID=UPI0020C651F4|nr:ANTAR domain-containing protein [Marinobacterium sedimentorum]MCP8689932.1 ANTAR domain-containing protein [Marinobacterium sedimentorum]